MRLARLQRGALRRPRFQYSAPRHGWARDSLVHVVTKVQAGAAKTGAEACAQSKSSRDHDHGGVPYFDGTHGRRA